MSNPIEKVLEAVGRASGHAPTQSQSGWKANCPAHDDRNPSLAISESPDGKILLHCHAGCTSDEVLQRSGLQQADLFPDARQRKQNPLKPTKKDGSADRGRPGKQVFPTIPAVVDELTRKKGEPSHVWHYCDPANQEAGAVLRWDGPDGKDFRPVSLTVDGWVIGAMPDPRPLYRLPSIVDAERIYVVEGEKCADALTTLDVEATTCSGGSKAASKTDWLPLAGKDVCILPDNDEPGRKYAEQVAKILQTLTPPSQVRIVGMTALWSEVPEKGDVADWLGHFQSENPTELRERLDSVCQAVMPRVVERPRIPCESFEPFPLDVLPDQMRKLVADGAASIGCNEASIALPLLTAYGAAIGNTRRLRLKDGWDVPPIIWSIVVGKSGSGKSPAWTVAMQPTARIEKTAELRHKREIAQWIDDCEGWSREDSQWKQDGKEGPEPLEPDRPELERYTVVDTTVEGLAPLLQSNPRGLLLCRDELSGWVGSFDRYAKGGVGADASHWLSMFNGTCLRIDRKTGEPRTIFVPSAAINICGGIQPGILRTAFGSEHRENGLFYRFLTAWPPHNARRWSDDEIAGATVDAVANTLETLYGLEFDIDRFQQLTPGILTLEPNAKLAFVEFFNQHGEEQQGLADDLASAWSKLEEYAARLAMVLHYAAWAENPNSVSDRLGLPAMEGGIRLARWFGNETRRIHRMLASDEGTLTRESLVGWITRKGGAVTVRDTQTGNRRFVTADDAEDALNELNETGYGEWIDIPSGPQGGRPTRTFRLYSTESVCKTITNSD
jgi:hypothetical protein